MSAAEVQRIMDQAPTPDGIAKFWPSPRAPVLLARFGVVPGYLRHHGWRCWEGERHLICVFLNGEDEVMGAGLYRLPDTRATMWQRLRRWVVRG
jgi:hypothetical protein